MSTALRKCGPWSWPISSSLFLWKLNLYYCTLHSNIKMSITQSSTQLLSWHCFVFYVSPQLLILVSCNNFIWCIFDRDIRHADVDWLATPPNRVFVWLWTCKNACKNNICIMFPFLQGYLWNRHCSLVTLSSVTCF